MRGGGVSPADNHHLDDHYKHIFNDRDHDHDPSLRRRTWRWVYRLVFRWHLLRGANEW